MDESSNEHGRIVSAMAEDMSRRRKIFSLRHPDATELQVSLSALASTLFSAVAELRADVDSLLEAKGGGR